MTMRLMVLLVALFFLPDAFAQTAVKYVHTDALGSVVAMTDASGAIVESTREYEPYGQQLTPAVQDGPGYTGHVQDAATGLTYMQQRYYDPGIGGFLSVDPVTAYSSPVAMFNRYRYAANNPYRFKDPDGRYQCVASATECANVSKAVREMRSAERSSISGGTRISQVGRFFGSEGVANGVVVGANNQMKASGTAETFTSGFDPGVSRMASNAPPRGGSWTQININFNQQAGVDDVLSTLFHEGVHGLQQHSRMGRGEHPLTTSRTQLNLDEVEANHAAAQLFNVLGRNSPDGAWTQSNGFDWEVINGKADASVRMVCGSYPCDP